MLYLPQMLMSLSARHLAQAQAQGVKEERREEEESTEISSTQDIPEEGEEEEEEEEEEGELVHGEEGEGTTLLHPHVGKFFSSNMKF